MAHRACQAEEEITRGLHHLFAAPLAFRLKSGLLEPLVIGARGEGIMAFIQVFSDNSTALYNMFVSMATLLVDAYRAIMPQVVAAVTETIIAVVQAYRTVTPLLIAAFTETIVLLLESARTILPEYSLSCLYYLMVSFSG